ncbi:hypothetical protein SAMN04487947_3820 [Halogeometricum rufum]|jgi:uncharacterized protein with PIN domain|uniref:Uncharacterized protein n=1 Tax=Halogeometricum rufum TaxID=553469 RepID=A0A1I6IX45_9EURY|nr:MULTISPECIES: hypothetical protein [Halogeometricum]MUV57693.1 hypothetical protein [Halogeometricum sp. CBA1124]SFR71297.1 hypothetical protein SAMN04487947_3820 [Halogeometricum rufum]
MSSEEHEHEGEHEHEDEEALTECPECGAEITGEESLESKTVPELRVDSGSVYAKGKNDLWLCKGCRATLGVKLRER